MLPPGFPLTGAASAVALVPPPNPYGPPPTNATAATIRGMAGQFTIRPGSEVRVGRDPAQCPIFLAEPRVSGCARHIGAPVRGRASLAGERRRPRTTGPGYPGARSCRAACPLVPPGAAAVASGPGEFSIAARVHDAQVIPWSRLRLRSQPVGTLEQSDPGRDPGYSGRRGRVGHQETRCARWHLYVVAT